MDIEAAFKAAVNIIRSMPKNGNCASFYNLYFSL